jgi:hypothetical protein
VERWPGSHTITELMPVTPYGREGLDLLEPGVVTRTKWRPDPDDPNADTDVYQFWGLARKA